jgi:hypothetical protein
MFMNWQTRWYFTINHWSTLEHLDDYSLCLPRYLPICWGRSISPFSGQYRLNLYI